MSDTTTSTAKPVPALTLDDIKRNFFTPDSLDKAMLEIQRIGQIANVDIKSNVPLSGDAANALIKVVNGAPSLNVPAGYGVAITPIQERVPEDKSNAASKKITVASGVFIGVLPTIELLAKTSTEGAKLVTTAVANSLMTKVLNAIRPNKAGETGEPPLSIEQFIESGRTGPDLSAFKKLGPAFVDYFKSKGVSIMNLNYLRQAFQSKAFSVAQFGEKLEPHIVKALNNMHVLSERQGLSLELLDHWISSRDNAAAFELADDVSFEDMDTLVAE